MYRIVQKKKLIYVVLTFVLPMHKKSGQKLRLSVPCCILCQENIVKWFNIAKVNSIDHFTSAKKEFVRKKGRNIAVYCIVYRLPSKKSPRLSPRRRDRRREGNTAFAFSFLLPQLLLFSLTFVKRDSTSHKSVLVNILNLFFLDTASFAV